MCMRTGLKRPNSMLGIDKDFVIALQSFKENNGEQMSVRVWACAYLSPLLSEVRKSRIRPKLCTNLLHICLGFSHILDKIYGD